MNGGNGMLGDGAGWLEPSVEQSGLVRYISTLREHKWLVIATVVLTTLIAAIYVAVAPRTYTATANVLITPVPDTDTTLAGLGLVHDSSDPTRDVQTAATTISTFKVAQVAKQRLNDSRSPTQILHAVSIAPVAQSNVVAITASDSSALGAKRLANGFAEAAIAWNTQQFQAALNTAITHLTAQIGGNPPAAARADVSSPAAQLGELEALRGATNPTIHVESLAQLPTAPTSPKKGLSIGAGILAGLVLGIGGAFAISVLDPKLRREEQLRARFALPILARIPHDSRAHTKGALPPEQLAPATIEAYRTLRATVAASKKRAGSQAILVTSSGPSEGKSTTAINLASSFALAGHRVILIEADLRRPAVGQALGVHAEHATGDVLLETVSISDALVTTKAYGNYLQLLLASYAGGATAWMADRLFLPSTQNLLDNAKQLADYVIIDSPPLSEVIDALPLAQRADEVIVVARLGKTQLSKLTQLNELLARHFIRPVGFAVVGAHTKSDGYYYSHTPTRTSRVPFRRHEPASPAGASDAFGRP